MVACTVPITREHREVGPGDLPDEYRYRFSFCCDRDGCRKRVTPPSVRFLGRRVYLGAVVILIGRHAAGTRPRGGSASFPGCSMSIQQPSLDEHDLLARPRSQDAVLEVGPCSPRACCRDRRPAAIARRGVRAGQRSLSGLGAALAISIAPDYPELSFDRHLAIGSDFPQKMRAPKVLIKRVCVVLTLEFTRRVSRPKHLRMALILPPPEPAPELFADRLEPRCSKPPQPIAA